MGLGTEILFLFALGLLLLGPTRLHVMLGHVARAKAQWEEATRGFTAKLGAELDAAAGERTRGVSPELAEDE